jgi:hypothetical protein
MTLNVLLTDVIITLNMNYITNLVCFLNMDSEYYDGAIVLVSYLFD